MFVQKWMQRGLSIASLVTFGSLAHATTWIVDDSGGFDFTDIQSAINAASDDDTIFVRPGNYTDFLIDDKSLSVFAMAATPNVNVLGTMYVSNLSKGKRVVLSGISAVGRTLWPMSEAALVMNVNVGAIRIQNCTLRGGAGIPFGDGGCHWDENYGSGGVGADLFFCTDVAFNACTMIGGDGFGLREASCFDITGGHGGHGVEARSSRVALYDCTSTGGKGGWMSDSTGGNGGNGYFNPTGGVFASGTTFQGGAGGNVSYFNFRQAGNGGHGVFVGANGNSHLLDEVAIGGVRGVPTFSGQVGQPGIAITGPGLVEQLAGARRKCTAGTVVTGSAMLPVTIVGQPGDQVFLPSSKRNDWKYIPASHGTRLMAYPTHLPIQPVGVIPASGTLTTQMQLPQLPAGLSAVSLSIQAIVVDTMGEQFLAGPMHVIRR